MTTSSTSEANVSSPPDLNALKKIARFAGWGYLAIILCGLFAEFFVRQNLIVPGDAATTAKNIAGSEQLFRAGIASDLVMLSVDVAVAWALYALFAPVSRSLALVAMLFRLVQIAILGVNMVHHYLPLMLLNGDPSASSLRVEQTNALASLFMQAHGFGYLIGLVFFGIHCALLGRLFIQSGYMPSLLGVLLMLASAGYLIDSFGHILAKGYSESISMIVLLPAFVAEIGVCLYLIVKGVSMPAGRQLS